LVGDSAVLKREDPATYFHFKVVYHFFSISTSVRVNPVVIFWDGLLKPP